MTAMYEDALHDEGEGERERERVCKTFNVESVVAQNSVLSLLII